VNKNGDILLKLVRMAMGWESDFSLPEDIDWRRVFEHAQEQGVNAIVLDGLEKYMNNTSHKLNAKDKQFILEAIGNLQLIEFNNQKQLSALLKLSEILNNKGIPFMIMKGFACAQYYPNSKHRTCGDIDIYTWKRFNDSNQALEDAGVPVEPDYYRHTASFINGVMIENHRVLCDLRGPRTQTMEFEKWLEREARRSFEKGKPAMVFNHVVYGGLFPSANFNALFLPWHVSSHFMFERVTIRQLLDWSLFLIHEGKHIDVEMYREAKRYFTYGFSKIADAITNLSLRYLKIPKGDIPIQIIEDAVDFDEKLADDLFNYMFHSNPRERDENVWKFRWNNVKRVWNDRWKYKDFYGMGSIKFLFYKTYGALFHIGE
jgi:hypothetical protein